MIKIRIKKPYTDGRRAIYFDLYKDGVRSYEFPQSNGLKLYLTGDKKRNAETMRLAETMRANREIELQTLGTGIIPQYKGDKLVIGFLTELSKERKLSNTDLVVINNLKTYVNENFCFKDITPKWIEKYRAHLQAKHSINSASLYFDRFKFLLNFAIEENYLKNNPLNESKRIPTVQDDNKIKYLIESQIRELIKLPCKNPNVKRASIFSIYTGMAYVDVCNLKWEQIKDGRLTYIRQKTKRWGRTVTMDLTPDALKILSEQGKILNTDNKVFKLTYRHDWIDYNLRNWLEPLKLDKITFHMFRHTFGTMHLNNGTPLPVLRDLMGHKSVKETERYARILDTSKSKAQANLPNYY